MRIFSTTLLAACVLLAQAASAQEGQQRNAVKTGILPDGGIYTVYEVTCSDQRVSAIASVGSRSRWCTAPGGDLACFRRASQAGDKACSTTAVAANDSASDDIVDVILTF